MNHVMLGHGVITWSCFFFLLKRLFETCECHFGFQFKLFYLFMTYFLLGRKEKKTTSEAEPLGLFNKVKANKWHKLTFYLRNRWLFCFFFLIKKLITDQVETLLLGFQKKLNRINTFLSSNPNSLLHLNHECWV